MDTTFFVLTDNLDDLFMLKYHLKKNPDFTRNFFLKYQSLLMALFNCMPVKEIRNNGSMQI